MKQKPKISENLTNIFYREIKNQTNLLIQGVKSKESLVQMAAFFSLTTTCSLFAKIFQQNRFAFPDEKIIDLLFSIKDHELVKLNHQTARDALVFIKVILDSLGYRGSNIDQN